MKRTATIFLPVALLLIVGGLGIFAVLDKVQTAKADSQNDVEFVTCVKGGDTIPAIDPNASAFSLSNGANAPSVLLDVNCAESLADLLNLGFKVVEANDAGSFVSYTLERK